MPFVSDQRAQHVSPSLSLHERRRQPRLMQRGPVDADD